MRKFIFVIFLFVNVFFINAQVHVCTSHRHLKEDLKNVNFRNQFNKDQAQLKIEEESKKSSLNKAGTIYTVPVVFHVLHNGGSENISDGQIEDALRVLNRDFRKQNPDANTVVSNFQSLVADIEIEFAFATIAPDGSCFKGVTRTRSPRTNDTGTDNYEGGDQVDAIVAGNDVYQGYWNPSKYLNIYICKSIGGFAAGYTRYPSSFYGGDMELNGIFMLSTYIGSIGTSNDISSRVLTHEVGHWINLPHTWGNSNEPGLQSNCNGDDGVSDTPNTIGNQACILTTTSCGSLDNVENYMNYAGACRKMFTTGQKSRMRTALTSSIADRNNLWKPANLNEVGANGNLILCRADFTTENNIVCSGTSVQFNDQSLHNPTSWSWSFPGGTPSTSTLESPLVTYNSIGEFSVSLRVSSSGNSLSESKTNYIKVLNETGVSPIQEGFETGNFTELNKWFVNSLGVEEGWELTTSASSSGNKSIKINNHLNSPGSIIELLSSTTNLESSSSAVISFDYAYARKTENNTGNLKLYVSDDCGNSWFLKKSLSGSTLRTAPNTFGEFTPGASQWKTATVQPSSLSNFLDSDFRMRFVFENGGGNNIYLDNINIGTPASIQNNSLINEFSVYPNPASNEVNLSFINLESKKRFSIKVYDVVGKEIDVIYDNELSEGSKKFKINTSDYEPGVYFISLVNKTESKLHKFVVNKY